MILSSQQIVERMNRGELKFDPGIDIFQLQMHSVDLRIGFNFFVPKSWEIVDEGRVAVIIDHLDLANNYDKFDTVSLREGQFFDLLPEEYVAVSTLEKITLPSDMMAVLYPRSSVNRRGLSVDLTGIVDAGYEGYLLIPIRNNTKHQVIRIYPGERFCQLVFQTIGEVVEFKKSRWHNSDGNETLKAERSVEEMHYVKSGQVSHLKIKYPLIPSRQE